MQRLRSKGERKRVNRNKVAIMRSADGQMPFREKMPDQSGRGCGAAVRQTWFRVCFVASTFMTLTLVCNCALRLSNAHPSHARWSVRIVLYVCVQQSQMRNGELALHRRHIHIDGTSVAVVCPVTYSEKKKNRVSVLKCQKFRTPSKFSTLCHTELFG